MGVSNFKIHNFLFFVFLTLLLEKVLLIFGFRIFDIGLKSKYALFTPWSFLLCLIIVCGILCYKHTDAVVITSPIVFTMFFMTTFEYVFVKSLDKSTSQTILEKGKQLYKTMTKDFYYQDEKDTYGALKFCHRNGEISNSYIKTLNESNFAFVYGVLAMIVGFHFYKCSQQSKKSRKKIYFNSIVSILTILFLFLFYFVNISSKYPVEPDIAFELLETDNVKEHFEKTNKRKLVQTDTVMTRHNAPVDFCLEVCNDASNCTAVEFIPYGYNQKGTCNFTTNKTVNNTYDTNKTIYEKK